MRRVSALQTGRVVAGKYRIERRLGSGGMGVVVAARHLELDRVVALKFLRAERLGSRDVQRFVREAKLAASMRNEHVARILDAGSLPAYGPFMVLEYLEGSDLARIVGRGTRVAPALAAAVAGQVCEALDEAHGLGIVHRDIKPANLFVSRHGGRVSIKVLDFGIAKRPDDVSSGLTASDAFVGSPAYMAPEQVRQIRPVDARSDLWSVGVVLYEMIAGRLPFRSSSFADLCMKILLDEPEAMPGDLEVPPGLLAVVLRALSKEPADRFTSATELGAALLPYAVNDLSLLGECGLDDTGSVVGTETEGELQLLRSKAAGGNWSRKAFILAAVAAALLLRSEPPVAPPPRPAVLIIAEPDRAPAAAEPSEVVVPPVAGRQAEPSPSPSKRRIRTSPRSPTFTEVGKKDVVQVWDPLASPY